MTCELKIRQARGLIDFLKIRYIRNSCRYFMTRNQDYISVSGQFLYFLKYYSSDILHILYIGEDAKGNALAYGLISYDKNLTPWISGGLIPEQRGKGYGAQLFKFLSEDWSMSVYLEVFESNIRAHKLYTSLGFKEAARERRLFGSQQIPEHTEVVITMKKDA